jgi:alanyl aminopeptidase
MIADVVPVSVYWPFGGTNMRDECHDGTFVSFATCVGWALLATTLLGFRASADTPPTGRLPDTATPLSYALELKVDPRADRFTGQVRIRVKLATPLDHIWLHASELDVAKIDVTDARGKVRAARLAVRDPSGVVELSFGGTLPAQDIEVVIDYSAAFNAKLQGLYKVKVGDDAYAVTQMEPTSARYAFPSFDEPRFKTPFRVTLNVPSDAVAIANTQQIAERPSADAKWKTLTFATTKPLPTYLIAVAVGPWDVIEGPTIPANSVRKGPIPLRGIGPRGSGPQLRWILDQTPMIVTYYEDYTAQPYPFDKLDLLGAPDFGAGAMENAGLIVFRDAYLRIDASSPASTYRAAFNVTAHEIAHQWFGDLVTVPWWNDIWLNEAFATWAQGKATVDLEPAYAGDLARLEGTLGAMGSDSLLSARKIRQPITNFGDIQTAFDGITYQKGAAVLRMFEEWLGEDTYRAAMREYLAKHAYGSGSSDDLVATIAKVSGKGEALRKAMHSFLDQPGIPLVHTSLTCANGTATLGLSQSRYLPYGVAGRDSVQWSLPVCVRLDRGERSAKQCFLLDRPQHDVPVEGGCTTAYLPNADAAGYYRFLMPAADLAALSASIAALKPPEQLIFADAVSSAFVQGSSTPGEVLDAMPALSGSEIPQVATALFDRFAWIRKYLATDATRPALDAYAATQYAGRAAALGLRRQPSDTDAITQLRVRLVEFLAFTTRDAALRRDLNDQGRLALGLNGTGTVDLSRVDPDIREAALEVAVQDSGAPAFKAVLGELAVNHQTRQRYELLAALGATHDPELGEQARDYGTTSAVAVGELRFLYGSLVAEPENIDAFWQWLKTHYDALAARLPDQFQSAVIHLAAVNRCSKPQSEELRGWFAPRIQSIVGGERVLAQSLEAIDQCTALREHVGEASLAIWAAAHPAR